MTITEIRTELKKSLNRLERKSRLAELADEYFELNPFDEDAEAAFDRAYENEFLEFVHAANLISKMIGCDEKTARTMIKTNKDAIMAII